MGGVYKNSTAKKLNDLIIILVRIMVAAMAVL